MIYGMGLPRHGGQTLKNALHAIFGPEFKYYHSVSFTHWHVAAEPTTMAVLECFAPIKWCVENFRQCEHCFIVNRRIDTQAWLASMKKVHRRAHDERWNHPIWCYHPSQWERYAEEYYDSLEDQMYLQDQTHNVIHIDPTTCGREGFEDLCAAFGRPVPTCDWPNVDEFGRQK